MEKNCPIGEEWGCMEEKCAWWVKTRDGEEGCALAVIAKSLNELNVDGIANYPRMTP